MIQIYHNPKCGKSRESLKMLQESGADIEVIHYLKDVPSVQQLKQLIAKLGIKPIELVRQKETVWVSSYKDRNLTDDEIIKSMVDNPILIERPIIVNGESAVIARPAKRACDLL